MRAQRLLLARAAPQMGGEEEQRMVLQIATYAAQVGDDVDPERAQFRRRAYAGAQQKGRRMNSAGAKQCFSAAEIPVSAIDNRRDAADAPPVEQESGDGRAGHDRQVLAAADARIEIT